MNFQAALARYQQLINSDIATYAAQVRQSTVEQFGEPSTAVTGAFLDLLEAGGKRIRGTLVMVGYEMCGGQDRGMITRAATALELLHASMLIIDDIQDHDVTRRGKPAVHVTLADYHRELGMQGDAATTGISLALNAALGGSHAAQALLAGLSAEPELKVAVVGIVNHTVIRTLHGQTHDIINAGLEHPTPESVARATEWKSAHYTFLNPLCVGMVLAGAGCEDTNAIRDYALNTGIAFQLTDDLLDGDVKPAAILATRQKAQVHMERAIIALRANAGRWQPTGVAFLEDLARFVTVRSS